MRSTATFLNSKVARRIFFLFVCCALLPITLLAVISFFQVSAQLREDAHKQLFELTKAQSMEIYERLQVASSEIQFLSSQGRTAEPNLTRELANNHFLGMAVFRRDGLVLAHWGQALDPPVISEDQWQHLDAGKPVVVVHACLQSAGSCVAIVGTIDVGKNESELLMGEIDPDYLWDWQSLPSGFDLCALTSSRTILYCSAPEKKVPTNSSEQRPISPGLFTWTDRGIRYDTASRALLLRPAFFTDFWTIDLSRKQDDILAPLHHFRSTFPFAVLLALWIVTLASSVQIRRTLGPLEKLRAGTRDIAEQHFDHRVEVRSGDEFEQLSASFNSMTSRLGRQFHALKTINDIDQAIFASLNREAIMDAVLGHMPDLLPGDCFAITVFDQPRGTARTRLVNVINEARLASLEAPISREELQQLEKNPEALTFDGHGPVPAFLAPLRKAGMASITVLPIIVDKAVFAALIYACADSDQFFEEDTRQARQVADQMAVAFSHSQLIEALEQLHWGTLTALARAIDAKSAWTAGHSERVTNLAIDIGRVMGLAGNDLQIMHRGGLLHDIGKIGIPPAILDKPGKLDTEETETMQSHVAIGIRILEPIPGFQEALPIVAQHHEWFNGRGYPEGLSGEQISLHARIFAVADCYDAMTSDRPYRKGLPRERALEVIRQQSGTQFDPRVAEAFLRWSAEKQGSNSGLSPRAAGAGQGL